MQPSTPPPAAVPVPPRIPDFPRQFGRTRRFSLGVPRQFTVSADGRRVLYLRTGGGADPAGRLWLLEDGTEHLLAGPPADGGGEAGLPAAERVRRERARETGSGVVAYAADAQARTAAYALGGALWAVRTDGGAPFPVTAAGPVVDPRPSPCGRLVAYVTAGALHVTGLRAAGGAGGRPADGRLAAPEGPEVTYGLSDHVSAESMGRLRGYWWAPDGGALLVARTDTSRVARRHLTDPADPAAPPRVLRYPAAGTANAEVTLHLLGLDGGRRPVRWDREAFEYVPAAGWDAHGPFLAVQSRDQRLLRTLAVDPATGETRLLHEQRDPDWVELIPGTPCRTAGGALVVTADDPGTRRLTVDGTAVTPPGLQVREVLGTHGESVLFAGGEEPSETHVWRWSPGGGCTRLSEGPGVHTAVAAGGTTVLAGRVAGEDRVTVHRAGARPVPVASHAERPVVTPRPAFLRLGARELRSNLFLPSWHAPGRRLPVLLDPYGGQQLLLATRALGWPALVSQWFAEQGFAVLVTDGRGSPGRGPAWEKAIRGDLLTYALQDQVDALHAAAEHCPDLDTGRVAIRGWSFGGFLAAGAVLRRPDVFHAAVAGAPPTDHRLYDTHWKERTLGHPDEEPENYDRCSLLPDAPRLRRPLLLIHGLADDNVAAAHTLRLSAALLAAGRPHRVLPLPGAGHLVTRENVAERLLPAQLGFLQDALGTAEAVPRPDGPAGPGHV
ncbi:prolyl oligopeptidase family serine peptidase [Streptomyces sp. JJ36]|uniref:prolyl oligopeptidase family serine peptidase n=1 Tax=Streptomyces sp. JJ36 TaxID=2736645 RepID=UPI001F0060D2|nr:prolyl oligopeptidase family serine peptidase [Streptomyces sp. JJ36]MCF6525378.1 prolyl oligopeptidase family serine peptidase [Streptomyces sp. JJ36]